LPQVSLTHTSCFPSLFEAEEDIKRRAEEQAREFEKQRLLEAEVWFGMVLSAKNMQLVCVSYDSPPPTHFYVLPSSYKPQRLGKLAEKEARELKEKEEVRPC
jgi:hypothetical protein